MDYRRAKDVVETWNFNKVHERGFNQTDMRRFIEIMNDRTKAFVHACAPSVTTVEQFQELAITASDAITVMTEGELSDERYHKARALVDSFGVHQLDFYTGVMELAIHACTLLTPRAKIIADGIDRTNV